MLNACRSPQFKLGGNRKRSRDPFMKSLFVPPWARSLIAVRFTHTARALQNPANVIQLGYWPSVCIRDAADCSGMKLCRGTRATFGCWFRLHNVNAAELYEATFLDLACLLACFQLVDNLTGNNNTVPGGFALIVVDREGKAGGWFFAPSTKPRITTESAGQLHLLRFLAFGADR